MGDRDLFIQTFREVQPKFSRFMARSLHELDLTLPQYALLNLVVNAGKMPMTEASAKLHISKPAVTNLVDRLEANKFLKRLPDPGDRRVSFIKAQPKGEKIVRKIQTTILGFLLRAFGKFNSSEKRTIRRFYRLLSVTLDEFMDKKKKK